MIALTEWLMSIEHLANEFYCAAADYYAEDPPLNNFLQHIADDEADHYHIMSSAAHYLRTQSPRESGILVDKSIMEKIEAPFRYGLAELEQGTITKEKVLALTVDSETSEWNDIFHYVLNTLKTEERIFEAAANRIDHHVQHIENFLRKSGYAKEKLEELTRIPYEKKRKVLVVDDEEPVATVVARMLDEICETDLAGDGQVALGKIKNNVYDLIISDVDMPKLNGVELYKKAHAYFLRPQEAFIFHSGLLGKEESTFFAKHNLKVMQKPSSVMEIREAVMARFHLIDSAE